MAMIHHMILLHSRDLHISTIGRAAILCYMALPQSFQEKFSNCPHFQEQDSVTLLYHLQVFLQIMGTLPIGNPFKYDFFSVAIGPTDWKTIERIIILH